MSGTPLRPCDGQCHRAIDRFTTELSALLTAGELAEEMNHAYLTLPNGAARDLVKAKRDDYAKNVIRAREAIWNSYSDKVLGLVPRAESYIAEARHYLA